MITIFCPQCETLVLDAPECGTCGWVRRATMTAIGEPIWRATLHGRLRRRPPFVPVVARGRLCIVTEDGSVVALDAESGQPRWDARPGEKQAHALVTDGTRLFVSSADDTPIPRAGSALVALDARDGAEVWRYESAAHSLSAPLLHDNLLYCATSSHRLIAIDAESGRERWSRPHPRWGRAAPAVAAGVIAVGGRGEHLVAYDLADQRERWRRAGEGWVGMPLASDGSTLYVTEGERRLLALDAERGETRWQVESERGQGFTSPPTVTGELLLIGSRLFEDPEAAEGPTYGLLALRAVDGAEAWRFYTSHPIAAPCDVAPGLVFVGTSSGSFHALDAERGEERWRIELTSRTVARPLVYDDAVYVGQRDGTLYALRWRSTAPEAHPDPVTLHEAGDIEGAAVAYALAGDHAAAATLYARELDLPRVAAQLYERAGRPGEAARLWETLEEWERAGARYAAAGQPLEAARVLERGGKPLEAARAYEAADDLGEAARLYESAGDRHLAATLYGRMGETERARAIYQSLGDWERESQTLIDAGELDEAARLLEMHGKLERAADLYQRAERWAPALALRERLEHWEEVVKLADRLDDLERLAAARAKLDHPRRAAEAYERAAERLVEAVDVDEPRVASLYAEAARWYHIAFEEERAAECERQMRRYRRLPDLDVSVEAPGSLVEHHWTPVKVYLENRGFGRASRVTLAVESEFFTGRGVLSLPGIRVGRRVARTLHVRPNQEDYGRLPLDLRVTYRDDAGGKHLVSDTVDVDVIKAEHYTPTPTPPATPAERVHAQGSPSTAYLNFDLRLTRREDGYLARVHDSPVGQAEALVDPKIGEGALDLKTGAGVSRRLGLDSVAGDPRTVTDVGQQLFKALFPEALLVQWRRSIDRARDRGAGLRLRLWLTDVPELATLPWEALYDAENDLPLSLSRHTPVVRYLDHPSSAGTLGVRPPLHLLALLSDPSDVAALDVEGEWHHLSKALARLDNVEVERVARARLSDLQSALRANDVHILHYVGHGVWDEESESAALVLEDDERRARHVPSGTLGTLLRDERSLRLVVLNACEGARGSTREAFAGAAQQLVRKGIPAVIAMQAPISDRAAIAFAGEFYGALADGDPVDAALAEARKAIHSQGSDEWVLPVLFMRAADSMLFRM